MAWSNQKDEFKQYIIKKNEKFEQTTEDEDTEINLPFTTAEVDTGILKAKNSKAPSIDGVIYEVLKNENTSEEIFLTCVSTLIRSQISGSKVWYIQFPNHHILTHVSHLTTGYKSFICNM